MGMPQSATRKAILRMVPSPFTKSPIMANSMEPEISANPGFVP
jgi:hypothetical protein